jgi:hypothetical protein
MGIAIGKIHKQGKVVISRYGDSLVVLIQDELDDDLLLGLELEHLQDEAHELARLVEPPVHATIVRQRDRLVDQSLRREAEAVLLPVLAPVDLLPQDLLDEVLRVGPMDRPGQRVRPVRHGPACGGQKDRAAEKALVSTLTVASHARGARRTGWP